MTRTSFLSTHYGTIFMTNYRELWSFQNTYTISKGLSHFIPKKLRLLLAYIFLKIPTRLFSIGGDFVKIQKRMHKNLTTRLLSWQYWFWLSNWIWRFFKFFQKLLRWSFWKLSPTIFFSAIDQLTDSPWSWQGCSRSRNLPARSACLCEWCSLLGRLHRSSRGIAANPLPLDLGTAKRYTSQKHQNS